MQYDNEIHSIQVKGRTRTFYIDLKKSPNGFFVKMSEKSLKHGRTTIMFDAEDLEGIIKALNEVKEKVREVE